MQRYSQHFLIQHSLIIICIQNINTRDYFSIFRPLQGLFSQQVIISIPKLLVCHFLFKVHFMRNQKCISKIFLLDAI